MKSIITGIKNTYDIEMLIKAFFPFEKIERVQSVSASGSTILIQVEESQIQIEFYKEANSVYKKATSIQGSFASHHKLLLKRMVYQMLSKVTKQELPWGVLTGIRPTKIALEWLEKGMNPDEIIRILREDYLIAEDKIESMLEIATEELEILEGYTEQDYSLYVGIPYCPTRCLYCSFTAYSIEKCGSSTEQYLGALEKEIRYIANKFSNRSLRTLYIGGGTPTSLTEHQLDRLLTLIRNSFDLTQLDEWTVEAGRPDSITEEKLRVIKSHGVTRISINPQTMHQKTLDLIGRNHTIEQVIKSFKLARNIGFDNINMDIIIGLPDENAEDVKETLNLIQPLEPDSITVHALAIKRASKLHEKTEDYERTSVVEATRMQELTLNYAREHQLIPYYLYRQKNMVGNLENVGYAKKKKACIYNVLIMEEKQTILAVGAGSISKVVFPKENRIERIENVKSLTDYIERIDEMIKRKEDFFDSL